MISNISSHVGFKGITKEDLEMRVTPENFQSAQTPIADTVSINSNQGAEVPVKNKGHKGILTLLALAAAIVIGIAAHKDKIPEKLGGAKLKEWADTGIEKAKNTLKTLNSKFSKKSEQIEKETEATVKTETKQAQKAE